MKKKDDIKEKRKSVFESIHGGWKNCICIVKNTGIQLFKITRKIGKIVFATKKCSIQKKTSRIVLFSVLVYLWAFAHFITRFLSD